MTSTAENNKRIAKNTAMLYIRMLLIMAVTLYTSRVVLEVLGVEDFGIYNVVGGVVTMLGFLNSSLRVATQRYLNFEMGKGNDENVRRIFSVSFISYLLIALVAFALSETIGLWFVNNALVIPEDRLDMAIWVFHFSVLTFVVNLLMTPYNALIIAHEEMSIYAIISVAEVILKLLLVFLLTFLSGDTLFLYSLLIFLLSCSISLMYRAYCVNKYRESHIVWIWDKKLFKGMFAFSGWMLSGTITSLFSTQGINILINLFFGPTLNAARAVAVQVNTALHTFSLNFMTAVRPQLVKSYAQGDYKYMYDLVYASSRYSFYLLFILIIPIVLNTDFILRLWLNSVPDYAVIFTQLILLDLLLNTAYSPIAYVAEASGKVKYYQLTISVGFFLIAFLTWCSFKCGYPVYSTFIISILIDVLGLFVRLFVMYKIVSFPVLDYMKKVITPLLLIFVFSVLVSYIPKSFFKMSCLGASVAYILWIVCCTMSIIWILGLQDKEKEVIKNKIIDNLKR